MKLRELRSNQNKRQSLERDLISVEHLRRSYTLHAQIDCPDNKCAYNYKSRKAVVNTGEGDRGEDRNVRRRRTTLQLWALYFQLSTLASTVSLLSAIFDDAGTSWTGNWLVSKRLQLCSFNGRCTFNIEKNIRKNVFHREAA